MPRSYLPMQGKFWEAVDGRWFITPVLRVSSTLQGLVDTPQGVFDDCPAMTSQSNSPMVGASPGNAASYKSGMMNQAITAGQDLQCPIITRATSGNFACQLYCAAL